MPTDLSDFTDVLQREVNPPGRMIFTTATDDDWTGYLLDAFWEVRLDGFFPGWTADEDALVSSTSDDTLDFPREYLALVVVYGGIRILRNQIMNTNTGFRAKAGPVEFERQNSATMLAEMLKELRATKERIIAMLDGSLQTMVYGLDAIEARVMRQIEVCSDYSLGSGEAYATNVPYSVPYAISPPVVT